MPDYIFINARGHVLDEAAYSGETVARGHAERLAIENRTAVTLAEVIAYRVQPTCMLGPVPPRPSASLKRDGGLGGSPATILTGDWELCDACYNAIAEPRPELDEGPELELDGPVSEPVAF